jgi:hypothetical protein
LVGGALCRVAGAPDIATANRLMERVCDATLMIRQW